MTTMGLEYLKYLESNRANIANERIKDETLAETKRANLISEGLQRDALVEQRRSNLARENETVRANMAREEEILRSNLANESLQLSAQRETKRANEAREAENQRANMSRENISLYQTNLSNMSPLQSLVSSSKAQGYTAGQTAFAAVTDKATNILSSLFGTLTNASVRIK